MPALHAKAAADIAGDDAELGFRDVQNAARQLGARAVRALGPDIEREATKAIVLFADAAARLHRGGGHAVEDELQAGDVVGPGKPGLNRAPVAEDKEKALVVPAFRPQLWCRIGLCCFGRSD